MKYRDIGILVLGLVVGGALVGLFFWVQFYIVAGEQISQIGSGPPLFAATVTAVFVCWAFIWFIRSTMNRFSRATSVTGLLAILFIFSVGLWSYLAVEHGVSDSGGSQALEGPLQDLFAGAGHIALTLLGALVASSTTIMELLKQESDDSPGEPPQPQPQPLADDADEGGETEQLDPAV